MTNQFLPQALLGSRRRDGATGTHQDERALGEGRVDQDGGAGEREAEADVMQQQERRERPEDVGGEKEAPQLEELLADAGRV